MVEEGKNDPGTGDAPQDQLRSFLVDLATDPAALGRYVKDPEAAMAKAGLGAADQSVLRSGDPATINTRLVSGPGAPSAWNPETPTMMLVVDVTPGAGDQAEQVTVRPVAPRQEFLQVQPQFEPQQVVQPQFHPPQVHPQFHPPQVVHPQFHPPQVVHPQFHPPQVVHPQFHPQLVIQPQQVVHPQFHPQLVFPFTPGQ